MGEVVRFVRPGTPCPPPSTVPVMDVPADGDPHTHFSKTMRIWTIAAERMCGAKWCLAVTKNIVAYFEARVAMGADLGRKPK